MDIVWIHGFGEDSAVWKEFLPRIDANYAAHLFDHAQSTGHCSIHAYATDLEGFISERGLQAPVLIGHSMGGYIALEYAARHRVAGLGLFHSSATADNDEKRAERDKTRAFIAENGTETFIQNFYPKMFTERFRHKHPDIIAQNTLRYSSTLAREALMASTQSMKNRRDHVNTLKNFAFPVFQILGKQDKFIPLETALEQTALLQHPSALLLDQVAHAGMYEAPELCADFVNYWLSTLGSYTL